MSDHNYDPATLLELYQTAKLATQKVRLRYEAKIRAEIAAEKEAFEDYILEARVHDTAGVSRIAKDLAVARSSVYNALDSALERRGMTRADLASDALSSRFDALAETRRKSNDVFKVRSVFRENLHVAIPAGGDVTDSGIVNVYLDPREYRVVNVSRRENGAQPLLAGPEVAAWQAELDTPGSTLRNTVDRHNEHES